MDKLEQMKLLKEAIRTNYKGSLSELLTPQPTQEVANTPEEQEQGLRGLEEEQMPDSMVFPDVAPNQSFNTMGMKAPIDLQKVDNQGHLVQSYENVPPGIKNLPTGPAEGMVIESPSKMKNGGYKGYKQKYQSAGFKPLFPGAGNLDVRGLMNQELNNQNTSLDTNPAAAVQQNNVVTENLNTENKEAYNKTISNINTKKANNEQLNASEMAVIQAGPNAQFDTKNTIKKVTDMQTASLPENQGEFRDVVKDNMRDVMANSFLASQIASGYGGDYINQGLQDQNNYKEKFDNFLSGSGQKTMQQIALSTIGVGSSASLAKNPASTNFAKRALAYPTDKTAKGLNTLLTTPGVKGKLGTGLNTLYNYGYISGLPKVLSSTAEAAVGYSAGEKSGQDAGLQIGANALNYVPAVKNFSKLKPIANNYTKIKTSLKAGYDLYKGNPEDAALRMTELVGGGNSKYYKKYARKLIPDNFKTGVTKNALNAFVPKVYGGQPSQGLLNFEGE